MMVFGRYEDNGRRAGIAMGKIHFRGIVHKVKDLPVKCRKPFPSHWKSESNDRWKRYRPAPGELWYVQTEERTTRYCWFGDGWAILEGV